MARLLVVISQDRAASAEQQRFHAALVAELTDMPGVRLKVLPHLYDLKPDGAAFESLRRTPGDMVILSGLYPRAAFWILDANGVRGRMGTSDVFEAEAAEGGKVHGSGRTEPAEQSRRTIWCIDYRAESAVESLVGEVRWIAATRAGEPMADDAATVPAEPIEPGPSVTEPARTRWYPVVDYSRCSNCMECLNFCLFGVYGLDESGRIFVEESDACRPGCPACARICASGAIMFPQHADAAIAGGQSGAPEGDSGNDLLQVVGQMSAADMAILERVRALRAQYEQGASGPSPASSTGTSPAKSHLDRLVDDLDDAEL